ncbi:MAG: aminotransferase class I/II-fold pyridoxal phosphate-dependent enzyme [Acidimicrobiales bacterium]
MNPSFEPPPYPYHRLRGLEKLAAAHEGGLVDCSVGTPCDPPAEIVLEAMRAAGNERGYPESAGSLVMRKAAAGWIERRFGVVVSPEQIAACVGTKEFVASVVGYLHLRNPSKNVVLHPTVSYPTYAMGALLAHCRPVAVPALDRLGTGLRLSEIDPSDADAALCLWVNTPSNPTGGLSDLEMAVRWGKERDIPVLSDECYSEYTWSKRPMTILEYATEGVLAVHSLSKRSNLAGVRAGFYAGDKDLVGYLSDLRRHAGLMVPGPVQVGAAAALDDDSHVLMQRERYRSRLELLMGVLESIGCPAEMPEGGFYLWVSVPEHFGDGWGLAEELARRGGLLVSPGEFYGDQSANFIRVAAVQPLERLRLVVERFARSGLSVGTA